MSSSAGKIVLVGCSGPVGCGTVKSLAKLVGGGNIVVGTRDPTKSKASELKTLGVTVSHGDYNDPEGLRKLFLGCSAVYLIAPSTENRADLVKNGIEAAKSAAVPFLCVLSVPTADNLGTVFGRQFHAIEAATKSCGIPYCIIRMAWFFENLLMFADEIKSGRLVCPVASTAPHVMVAIQDCADAAAVILANPATHSNRTYTITGPSFNDVEFAKWYSKELGISVAPTTVRWEEMERMLGEKGLPAWTVTGTIELMHMADNGSYNFFDKDFKKLMGREPTTPQQWIHANRACYTGASCGGCCGTSSGASSSTMPLSGASSSRGNP